MQEDATRKLADTGVYRFGEHRLDLDSQTLWRSGTVVPLRPQSFAVLQYLVVQAGRLVTKSELIDEIWHGAAVSDDSISQCIADIRKTLGDQPPTLLRTVPRRGFVFDVAAVEYSAATDDSPNLSTGTRRKYLSAVVMAVVVGLIATAYVFAPGPKAPTDVGREGITVAVLASRIAGGGEDKLYVADDIAESIIGELSRSEDLKVVAYTSSLLAAEVSDDPVVISDHLQADYLCFVNARGGGEGFRIAVELIEPQNGTVLWTKSFEPMTADERLLDMKRRIARVVATESAAKLGARPPVYFQADQRDTFSPAPSAVDAYLQGKYYLRLIETSTAGSFDDALANFESAIEDAPNWAPPYAALGRALHFRANRGKLPDDVDDYERSLAAVEKAIELDPDYAPAWASLGFLRHVYLRDFSGAAKAYERLAELDDSMHWGIAIYLVSIGRYEEAIERYRRAILHDPLAFSPRVQLAITLAQCLQRYDEGLVQLEQALEMRPPEPWHLAIAARWHIRMGDTAGALQLLDRPGGEIPLRDDPILLALLGRTDEAAKAVGALIGKSSFDAYTVVPALLLLDQQERALDYLERVAREEPEALVLIRCGQEVQSLAGNPRYESVLDEVGFPR